MRLVLFRHGIAIRRDDPACPARDADRALTERGVARTRRAARGLASLQGAAPEVRPDVVLESPYLRAQQTADLFVEAFQLPPSARVISESMTPEADPDECLAIARGLGAACVAFIGHAPHLDDLLARALGWPRPFCALKKAGAALVDEGELHWILPPRVLRRLDGGSP